MSNKNDKAQNNNKGDEYQSMLLSRFLKEPRLPPSTNVINKRKSLGPKMIKTAGYRLNQTTMNSSNVESSQFNSNGGQSSQNTKVIAKKKTQHKQPVISYRQQSDIMKKIFGNEQNYNKVKSLFGQSQLNQPQQEDNHQYQSTGKEYGNHQESQRASSTPHQNKNIIQSYEKKLNQLTSPKQIYQQNIINKEEAFSQQIILAKSREQLEQLDYKKQEVNGGNDQVEKAIFDLQDVKNNYFQEKSLYDKKLQQIQIKQQNTTYANGFLQNVQQGKTSSSFFNSSARPMTQGGGNNFFKNQSLINDDNILKNNLDQISKEDLKERLVVAEMVMKKLFQRNKDLEDQVYNSKQNQSAMIDSQTQLEHSSLNQQQKDVLLKVKEDQNKQEVSDEIKDENCQSCIELRKEIASKETEFQMKINDLQLQMLNQESQKTDDQHVKYLKLRIEETMNEAKRHFTNYIQIRNTYNSFLESRLGQGGQISGGTKGQKIQNDILSMLKKNLEQQDHNLQDEQQQMKKSLLKIETTIEKKDSIIKKKDKKINQLKQEIERRQFVEGKVQKYVKGLISQNQRCVQFIESLKENQANPSKIEEFLRELNNKEYDEDEGESTENEGEENDDNGQSLEINDL